MKQTFVNNIQQLMTANENQRIKINYLESQKQKREQYLSGLRESVMLNKQTLIVLNQQGPNDQAITLTSKENMHLIKLNEQLYNENRQLNALLLMQQQLRVQDKAFYIQRIAEFENRITDLRKYLHDKEESFSSVVVRLKKYEEWGEKPLAEKIQDAEGLRKLTNQVLERVVIQRNMFKSKFQAIIENAYKYQVLQSALRNGGSNIRRLVGELAGDGGGIDVEGESINIRKPLSQKDTPRKQLIEYHAANNNTTKYASTKKRQQSASQNSNYIANFKQTPITKQLMRLLKKQKLNNQILQSALHEAIGKNQQLIKINQNLQQALNMLQKKMQKLIAQNYLFKQKVKSFTTGYGRKYQLNRVRDDSEQPAYMKLFDINFEIKDEDNQPVPTKYYKDLLKESLKEDIQRLLRIPIQMVAVGKCTTTKSRQNFIDHNNNNEQKIPSAQEMTTNDMTRLNEKIMKSKGKIQEQGDNNNSNPTLTLLTRSKPNTNNPSSLSQKVMIKSASEPRLFMEWQQSGLIGDDDDQHQAEEIVVDQF